MAITFVGSRTQTSNSTSPTAIGILLPDGCQAGDLALFWVDIPNNGSPSLGDFQWDVEAGWTQLPSSPVDDASTGNTVRGYALYKILDGSETEFGGISSSNAFAGLAAAFMVFRGIDQDDPIHTASSVVRTPYPITAASITTTKVTTLALCCGVHGSVASSDGDLGFPSIIAPDPTFTFGCDARVPGLKHVYSHYRLAAPAGTYAPVVDTTEGGSTAETFMFLIALNEACSNYLIL